jgi:hypothetical protein
MKTSLDTKQLNKRKWISISLSLQYFLRSRGIKILKIVDGIDNVHINDERSKIYYRHMIDATSKFLNYRPDDNVVNLLVMRERTYIDSCNYPIQQDTRDYIGTLEIQLPPAEFAEILTKRYEYAVKNIFNKGSLYDQIASKVIKNINNNNNNLHHNNVRAFLYNKMSLISLTYYRSKQIAHPYVDVLSLVKSLENRNRFLNGRLYLDTKNDWHKLNNELGLCCMNIFYYDSGRFLNTDGFKWPLLCTTRILQVLKQNPRGVNNSELIDYVHSMFGYQKEQIKLALDNLRAFGMVDSGFKINLYYEITEKGIMYLSNSFISQDALYYFALDSTIPEAFVSNNFVIPHDNKLKSHRSGYPSAVVISITSFLLFLNCVNNREKIFFKSAKKRYKKTVIHFDDVSLPFHSEAGFLNILKTGENIIKYANNKDIEIISNYIDKILTVINGSNEWLKKDARTHSS